MKLLIFSYRFYPEIGGIESISQMLAEYFFNEGHEVHLITKTLNTKYSDFSFKVINNPFLIEIIKEIKWADVVFQNNPCFSISYANFFIRKPSVITLQTWLADTDGQVKFLHWLKKILLYTASAVVACSKAVNKAFPKSVVIPNPYNQLLFKRIYAITKRRDFVFLGRLVSDKGADLAIKAFSNILKYQPYSTLTIIGDGEEMAALVQLVKNLQVEEYVQFKGTMEGQQLVECLNEHKFLLVPSVWKEPFGIVALEGLACGCLPIVSDGGGLPEATGDNGMIFCRGNIASLESCMLTAIQDYHPAIDMNISGINHLKAHAVPAIGKKYLELFTHLLKTNV